jgi:hypothetical protein
MPGAPKKKASIAGPLFITVARGRSAVSVPVRSIGTRLIAVRVPVAVPVAVPPRLRAMLAIVSQRLTPVLIAVTIIAAEVAVAIVVPVTAVITLTTTAMAPITVIIEPIHGIDQRISHCGAYQQVQCRIAIVVCARTQRNRQARRKPRDDKPLKPGLGSKGSVSNTLFSNIHRLVLFQQCNARMRCSA